MYLNWAADHLLLLHFIWNFFLKKTKRSGTSLPALFSAWILKKNISRYILLPGLDLIVWSLLFREILGNECIVVFEPGCDVINFEINLIFLIKPFFLYNQYEIKSIFHHF